MTGNAALHADLTALLSDPTKASTLSPEERHRLLVQASALVLTLAATQTTAPVERTNANASDRLLTVAEVHHRTQLSTAWLYRHANALPFTRRVGRKVLFSEAALSRWLVSRAP